MECDGIFKLASLPLKKLAIIALAQYYLDRPDAVTRMYDDLARKIQRYEDLADKGSCELCRALDPSDLFILLGSGDVMKYVHEQVDLLPIPEKLILEIKIILSKIWQKACYWRRHVIVDLRLPRKYAENIYWTSHGEIDVVKIFQDFWLRDNEFPGDRPKIDNSLVCVALMLAGEGLGYENFEKLKDEFLKQPPVVSKAIFTESDMIIAKWVLINHWSSEQTESITNYILYESEKVLSSKQPAKLPAGCLFLNCIANRFELGAKYFWIKLSMREKNDWGTLGANKCISELNKLLQCERNQWLLKGDSFDSIKIESYLKILLFLINEMTDIQKLEFIPQNFVVILKALCVTWPYQELCDKIFYTIWHHIRVNEEHLLRSVIMNYVNLNKYLSFDDPDGEPRGYESLDLDYRNPMLNYARQRFFNQLLRNVMDVISKEPKENVFVKDIVEVVKEFYKIGDYVSLSIIINDFHLVKYREWMLEIGIDYLKKMVDNRNYNGLNKIFKIMEFTEEESKRLKNRLNLFDGFLTSGADLQKISDVDTVNESKIQSDAAEICYILIHNNRFEKADEFLSWRFDTEEERENVKKLLDSQEFILNRIIRIWSRPLREWRPTMEESMNEDEVNKNACEELLKFFFGSEVEIQSFIETRLKPRNQGLVVKYWYSGSDKSLKSFDKFLEFCLFSNDEIEAMKIFMRNNINWWIDFYSLENYNFEMVHDLFHWIYGNDLGELKNRLNLFDGYLTSGADLKILDVDTIRESKNQSDAAEICYILIHNNRFVKADEFLSWRFDTEEERENVKKLLDSQEFILNKIIRIWSRPLPKWRPAMESMNEVNCEELLGFFFGSDVEIQSFKETRLKPRNVGLVVKYWYSGSDKSLKSFDKFLEFCLFSNDEIEAMKRYMRNTNGWIDFYALECYNFEMVQDLLEWLYGNDLGELKIVVENYITSPRRCMLFIKVFENFSKESIDRFSNFMNFWVPDSVNFGLINFLLDQFRNINQYTRVRVIKTLLQKRQQGKKIISSDFDEFIKRNWYS